MQIYLNPLPAISTQKCIFMLTGSSSANVKGCRLPSHTNIELDPGSMGVIFSRAPLPDKVPVPKKSLS